MNFLINTYIINSEMVLDWKIIYVAPRHKEAIENNLGKYNPVGLMQLYVTEI